MKKKQVVTYSIIGILSLAVVAVVFSANNFQMFKADIAPTPSPEFPSSLDPNATIANCLCGCTRSIPGMTIPEDPIGMFSDSSCTKPKGRVVVSIMKPPQSCTSLKGPNDACGGYAWIDEDYVLEKCRGVSRKTIGSHTYCCIWNTGTVNACVDAPVPGVTLIE